MKRSIVVKQIQEYLDHNAYYEYCNCAESILEIIEEAGMLPPSTDNKCSDPELSIGPSYFEEHVPQRIVLGWDDENT